MSKHLFFWRRLLTTYQGESQRTLRSQALRGTLISILIIPILFTCLTALSLLFGYQLGTAYGVSMEPTLRDGDLIWLKPAAVSDIRVGDIVTLSSPESGSITHRLIQVQRLPPGGCLLETKGDANWLTEMWEVSADGTVLVVVARVPFGGYIMDSLSSTPVRAVLLCSIVAIVIRIWVRRCQSLRH
jgi:signal peptidase